jgi:uncharacterized membrane protein YhaH (DUF805 family)
MATANPYRAPAAAVADTSEQYQEVKIFSTSGRIGRARYIAYSIGLSFLIMLVFGFVGGFVGAAGGGSSVGLIAMGIGYVITFVVMFMLTIQRAHDFNTTGWLSILVLIPLVNFIFWFIPGTDGDNRWGAQTPPNGVLVLIAAWLVPILFIGGIFAAIAIPAYSDYTKRATQFQKK